MLQNTVFGVIIPPGVLTSHPYAKLLPPWIAAGIVPIRDATFLSIHSGTLCLDCASQLSRSGAAT